MRHFHNILRKLTHLCGAAGQTRVLQAVCYIEGEDGSHDQVLGRAGRDPGLEARAGMGHMGTSGRRLLVQVLQAPSTSYSESNYLEKPMFWGELDSPRRAGKNVGKLRVYVCSGDAEGSRQGPGCPRESDPLHWVPCASPLRGQAHWEMLGALP